MTRNFPKVITVQAKKNKAGCYLLFFGISGFEKKVFALLIKGLKKKDIFVLLEGAIQIKKQNTHYNYYGFGCNSTIYDFKNKQIEGTIEVKHWGKNWDCGQIERVMISISKCEVPKVVFT